MDRKGLGQGACCAVGRGRALGGVWLCLAWVHPENWRGRMRPAVEEDEGSKRRQSPRR